MLEKDGQTLRTHLESVYRQTGVLPEQLQDLTELPDCIRHVWVWFTRLSSKRVNGMAVGPIASLEIEAWCRLNAIAITPFEVHALEALDNVYMNQQSKATT